MTITPKDSKIENKISTNHDHDKHITTKEFNKLTSFCCKISKNKFSN